MKLILLIIFYFYSMGLSSETNKHLLPNRVIVTFNCTKKINEVYKKIPKILKKITSLGNLDEDDVKKLLNFFIFSNW